MPGRRFLMLTTGFAALGLLWFPYVGLQEWRALAASDSVCEDHGIDGWRDILAAYSRNNGGRLPTAQQRLVFGGRYRSGMGGHALTCNTGAEYEWNPYPTRVTTGRALPVAWCGKPHGFQRKWRNVLFTDLTVRRLNEDAVQQWLYSRSPKS